MMLTGFFNAIYEMEGDDLFIAASPAGPAPGPTFTNSSNLFFQWPAWCLLRLAAVHFTETF